MPGVPARVAAPPPPKNQGADPALLARIEAKALGDVTASAKSGLMSAEAQYDLAMREVK